MGNNGKDLGKILRQRRRMSKLTLQRLSSLSGVSPSHLARIERKERFPSARILQKIAKPLNFEEDELFTLAGYLSKPGKETEGQFPAGGLDPSVASILAQESIKTQRALIDILNILHGIVASPEEYPHKDRVITAK